MKETGARRAPASLLWDKTMREDMFKVIVERPRLFRRRALRIKSRYDRLPDRTKVGMKRAAQEQRGWTKGLNENLAPLRRYLWKQRGRAWDDVYSEICSRLDTRSTVKQHVRDHLEDLIVLNDLENLRRIEERHTKSRQGHVKSRESHGRNCGRE